MADLSKIVCLEQDCRHGTEQTGSSGSGNDTYTKAEIDSKDADIRAAASEAKSAANNAQSVNQTQDGQIKALQEAVDNLHNYEHPTHKANSKGFYKFASDDLGHVSETEAVTKEDVTALGIPGHYYKFERNEKAEWYQDQNNELLVTKIDGANEKTEKIPIAPSAQICEGFDNYYYYFVVANARYCISDYTWYDPAGFDAVTFIRINGKHYGPAGYAYNAAIESDIAIVAPKFEGKFLGDNATTEEQGLMSPEDKAKLDGIDPDLYLPKAGGVMTGDIDMQTNKRDILVGTQKANTSGGTPVAGGIIEARANMTSTLPELRSFVGMFHNADIDRYYNVISVRHRNGYNDGNLYGMYIFSESTTASADLKWGKQTKNSGWTNDFTLLDSRNYTNYAAKSDHTHAMITNSMLQIGGANNAAKWVCLGTLVSGGDARSALIRVWSGNGFNAGAYQNASFEIQIKDGYQSTQSAAKACGVTVYRINCSTVKVKVIPTAHNTYTVWVYLPWKYWNGNYAVYGRYTSWTYDGSNQTAEPEGTGSDTAYYDQAFLTSTVAKATEATAITETAWTDVPETNISPRYGKNIKYLKSGNTVYVRGSISFSQSLNNPCCGTMPSDLLPDDYQDHVFTAWNLLGGVPTAYPVVLAKDGKITLMNPTSKAQWFEAGRAYNFNFNYHIG